MTSKVKHLPSRWIKKRGEGQSVGDSRVEGGVAEHAAIVDVGAGVDHRRNDLGIVRADRPREQSSMKDSAVPLGIGSGGKAARSWP